MTDTTPVPRIAQWLLPAVLAGGLICFQLGHYRTLSSHEAYAVVPAREMLETGDWIVPRFAGVPRLQKPPLAYWSIAASARVCGELDEFAARLPAAVSAMLLAALMGRWANRWYGPSAGFAAVMMQLSAAWVLIFARKAEVDMLLCLATTAALYLIAMGESRVGAESRGRAMLRWLGVYAALSVAWLAKFHYGPALVLAPTIVHWAAHKQFRRLRALWNPPGLLLLAAAVCIWPALVLERVPEAWATWRGETVGRAVGELGRQPFWYYVPYLLWLPLPWTPFLLAAAGASWKAAWKGADPRQRFVWTCLLVQGGILQLSANKHGNYLLASMPLLTLLGVQGWQRLLARLGRPEPLLAPAWRNAAMLGWLGLTCLGTTVSIAQWPFAAGSVAAVGASLALGGLAALGLCSARKYRAAGWLFCAAATAAYMQATAWIVPARDHRQIGADFARRARDLAGQNAVVWLYQLETDPVAYYLRSPVQRADSVHELAAALNARGQLLVLAYEPAFRNSAELGSWSLLQVMPTDTVPPPRHPRLVLAELRRTRIVQR